MKCTWKKCQFCEQDGAIIQQADGLSFCSTGFPLGMWQLFNVFISAVVKTHLCPGFVFSPSAAVTIPESSKWFFSRCVQAPPSPAEIWYFKLWVCTSRKGGGMPTALLTNLQMHRTFFFFFFLIKEYLFFFNAGTETGKLVADGATLKRSLFKLRLFVWRCWHV